MGKRLSKIARLHAQIQVRDKIIGGLLQLLLDNKINIPDYLAAALNITYSKRIIALFVL